jgi:protein-disulfide isomerase
MKKFGALVAMMALSLTAMPVLAETPTAETGFTPAQKQELEAVIRQFLTEKEPETVMKAVEVLRQRETMRQAEMTKEGVSKNRDAIFNNPNDPVLGNPKGDVTVVEFYDYSCGYCKMAQTAVEELLKTDKEVRFVAKELPILGEGSVLASRAAIASIKQKKFEAFHDALMQHRGQFNETSVMEIAGRVGLDAKKLKADMNEKSVDDMIATNRRLANDLGVRGTPMFIIGEKTFPGAMDANALKQAIADARAAKK